jgi:hypothetical protein
MLRRCLQTLENGKQCNAPATDTSKYCRHHNPQLPPKPARETEMEPLHLPLVLDRPSALKAINIVLQAMGEGRVKRSVAGTLLSGIKLAAHLITEMAEAGETISPADMHSLRPMRNNDRFQSARTDDRLAVALAAAGESRKPSPFNAARPSCAYQSDVDPATARMVKEILAQSHELGKTKTPEARS